MRFMLNDYESSYEELLKKAGTPRMNLGRTISSCIGIYKTINNLNPELIKNLFKVCKISRADREQYKINLKISKFLLVLKKSI